MNYDDLIERLTIHFTTQKYEAEVADGKREFFDEAGVVDEESSFFEMRMTQFLEWYLFTRLLRLAPQTPIQYALQNSEFKMTEEERKGYENLANSRHSLFEFLKIRGEDIFIRDLFSGEKIVIMKSPIQIGFSREEFFEARLVPNEGQFLFTRAFALHPEGAMSYILAEVKKIRKADHALHEALILRLLKMRYKYEQYRHLKLTDVYTNEKRVRF